MAEAEKNSSKRTVQDILDSRRSFTFEVDGEEREFFISDPSGEEIRKADWQYSKVFNQALADGFPTQAQMLETLKERGILSDEYTQEVEQVRVSLAAALFKLENMTDEEDEMEREGIAIEVAELRDRLFRLNQKVNGPLGNTCENLAEDARTEFLTSRVVQNKDGSKVWETHQEYLDETNTSLTVKARFEVMLWLQGLESNFLENTPEQEALRKIAEKRLNDAVRQVQDTAEETEEPDTADEEPKTSTKKAATKKTTTKKTATKKSTTKGRRGRPKGSKNKKSSPKKDSDKDE